jgi:simple sugar transport system ATP-binding protein
VLQAHGIVHRYGDKRALDGVRLHLRAGEVHALMGQNGAGKSTLIKVLTGVEPLQAGGIQLSGTPLRPASPLDAQRLGISTVYQEVNLCANLSVAQNLFAGREPLRPWLRGGGIDWPQVNSRARERLAALGIDIDVRRELGAHSVAVQQMVAIARALDLSARVLILDEPTSSLDSHEVEQLFAALRRLRAGGMAILFVTHFLDQVYAIADRITVLRNGAFVGEYTTAQLDHAALVDAMVGRTAGSARAAQVQALPVAQGPAVLEARALGRRGGVHDVNLHVSPGEIVGLAGLLGSGRTETARLLFGLDHAGSGEIRMRGAPLAPRSPADAIDAGLAFCPEDRKTEGILPELSLRDNIVLTLQARTGLLRRIPARVREELTGRLARQLDVRAASLDMPIADLSGGNQQKCLLARALATEPKVLILDEPTRGIDVAGRQEILELLRGLARDGVGIVFISSDIDELLEVSSRIVVLRDRRVVGELPGGCSEDQVYSLIAAPAQSA